jgi:enamine deaminase RidA (YjgF/YER057c/UK114 family)
MASQPQVELIRTSRLAARAPYAYAAVARDCSRLVFTAGACPLEESGQVVAVGDITEQAEQVMATYWSHWTPPALASRTW